MKRKRDDQPIHEDRREPDSLLGLFGLLFLLVGFLVAIVVMMAESGIL